MGSGLRRLIYGLICIAAICGCTVYQKPRPIHDIPFWERSPSKVDGEMRITVAVLTADESRRLFGVNLAGKGIQPVWVRVQNADDTPYWLMSTSLDPDYFSPMEPAYAFHGTFTTSIINKIDDQFRSSASMRIERLILMNIDLRLVRQPVVASTPKKAAQFCQKD